MTGLLRYGTTFRCREERILGLRFLAVTLPAKGSWRERLFAVRGAQLMQRSGITECVFPADFPLQALFERKGVRSVDRQSLLRA